MEKCGCGRDSRYRLGNDLYSCNRHKRCLSYEEQEDLIKKLSYENSIYKHCVDKIVIVNAMDYEYRTWAKEALQQIQENE